MPFDGLLESASGQLLISSRHVAMSASCQKPTLPEITLD